MMNRILLFGLACVLNYTAAAWVPEDKPATKDTTYSKGSGISDIWIHDNKVSELTNLGMIWGFIKYYHANVSKGDYNMDVALFDVLPQVLAAKNNDSANAVLERWVDGFGVPELCKKCRPYAKTPATKFEPDYGYLFAENNLPQTLVNKLEYIKINRYQGNDAYYFGTSEHVKNPTFRNEREYAATKYPDAGLRLLALYRYWNAIQYFFPYRHLIGEDWNKVLGDCLSGFCNAMDAVTYQTACMKLVTRINDTHAATMKGSDELKESIGTYNVPFYVQFIENHLTVTSYITQTKAYEQVIKPGDIIEEIDGQSVIDQVRKYLPITPASNYEKKLANMVRPTSNLLTGKTPTVALRIRRDGKMMELTVNRVKLDSATLSKSYQGQHPEGYKLMSGNIGYLFPGMLGNDDLEPVKKMMADTKGIIIDFRCYPTTFMTFDYGHWLKGKSSPFVQLSAMNYDYPGACELTETVSNGGGKGKHYKGKIVIIVNATTQSSAEYQTMALQSTPGAVVIGSQTSGADGNVSWVTLPGGLSTAFSGLGVLYPDGTESQRMGVKIDKEVRATVKGIGEGRDELLEEAMRMLND